MTLSDKKPGCMLKATQKEALLCCRTYKAYLCHADMAVAPCFCSGVVSGT